MRTQEEFIAIIPSFRDAICAKQGKSFIGAVDGFMSQHNFEQHVMSRLFEDEKFGVWFYTDNVDNDCGIMFVEQFGKDAATLVCTRETANRMIAEYEGRNY